MAKGKLLVFEGADGTGKTIQAKLLYGYSKARKIPVECISFPRYTDNLWGQMVRRYLDGEFGTADSANPYLVSVLYAGDRLLAAEKIREWLRLGKLVICDRYVASNIAHQVVKIQNSKSKIQFVRWIEEFEYKDNKITQPDVSVLLMNSVGVSQKFMRRRKLDIHEKNINYQKEVAKAYVNYARGKKNWISVSNMKGGKLRSIQDVHLEILENLKKKQTISG